MFDSHCHIHMSDYSLDADEELRLAQTQGVKGVICIGEGQADTKRAVQFVKKHEAAYLAVGIHPHSAKDSAKDLEFITKLVQTKPAKLVAVGECGLDYFYLKSPKADQHQ